MNVCVLGDICFPNLIPVQILSNVWTRHMFSPLPVSFLWLAPSSISITYKNCWKQVCICMCTCISPMQLQGLGHHAPEIWWTSAIKGRKTCDRYAAKNTLPPSFLVPPFPFGFVSELYLLMLNYQSDFFKFFHTTLFIYLSMQLKTTIFFLIKAAILDNIVDPKKIEYMQSIQNSDL